MALSPTRRQQLRLYLGYPSIGLQVSRMLESAMNAADANGSAELQAMIEAELDECLALDVQIKAARARQKFKQVEDVHFNIGGEEASLRSQGRMHVARLGVLLSCEVQYDPFSAGLNLSNVMKQG